MTRGSLVRFMLAVALLALCGIIIACAQSVALQEAPRYYAGPGGRGGAGGAAAARGLDSGTSARGFLSSGAKNEFLIIPRENMPANTAPPPGVAISGGTFGNATTTGRGGAISRNGGPPATQPTGIAGGEQAAPEEDTLPLPGSPILVTTSQGKLVPVPLQHTDVSAQITGYIASVSVTQNYANPFPEKIEAVYVFPLPENAGINDFVMTIGDRHIRGIIRERAEAEKIYTEARAQGYVASMMSQERPNIFTQKVANIEPGKKIDISIRYFHTLAYQDGWFEWVFPMVVGPRYNPAGSTDGVGAVARHARGTSGQSTEIQYLHPTERSGHDISLAVDVDAGVLIEDLRSVNHKISRRDGKAHAAIVQLDASDSLPNKDFVLRYKVAGNRPKAALFVQKDKDNNGGYFTLMIVPPEDLRSLPRRPVEMVFVVDTSGSMSGAPIAQAKAAVQVALSKMTPGDTFQVVQFASAASQMSPNPLDASSSNLARAQGFVTAMHGEGGTEMLQGINAALNFSHDDNRTRVVAFLTDGYIGNEAQILRALHQQLETSRVFSFGVGSSPNRYLLDAMARLGHGNAAYLSLNDAAEPVMTAYFDKISHPALTRLKVNFGSMKTADIYPERLPELFVGRPVVLTGRFTGALPAEISITGQAGNEPMTFTLSTKDAVEENPAIATVWARTKIADLHDEAIIENRDVSADVRQTALTYGLVSEFTNFLAVDSSQKTAGDHGTSVVVPVPMPEGVRYETTVQESSRH